MIHVPNSLPTKVFSFVRQNEQEKIFAVINFCADPQTVTFYEALYSGVYTDYFRAETLELSTSTQLSLKRWGYRIFVRSKP